MVHYERAWDDPAWREQSDTAWSAGCRWLQSWWRDQQGLPPGPFSSSEPERLVCSTLPLGVEWRDRNFLHPDVIAAVMERLEQKGAGGLVNEDRLRRNLLSSQPMCFNLFGFLRQRRALLLPWVRSLGAAATEITDIRIEDAPPSAQHFGGGSAFDAFVEYRRPDDRLGFVGIECKYAENLAASDVPKVRDPYKTFTSSSGHWRPDAIERLDRKGIRQLWLNTLLAQSLATTDPYAEGRAVVMGCAADAKARQATNTVAAELLDPTWLTWHPFEELVATIDGDDEVDLWRTTFTRRYLDFEPVHHLLHHDDPRRYTLTVPTAANVLAVAQRVLGDGSVVERLEIQGGQRAAGLGSRLAALEADLKQLRIDAGIALGELPER